MKKIIILFTLLLAVISYSCDYLDIVPDDTATLDDAFKNESTTEAFVFSCYGYIPNYTNFRSTVGWCTSNEFVGAYHWGSQWFDFMKFQQGEDNSSSPVNDLWGSLYTAIRQCYIFLNHVDDVVPVAISQADFEARKNIWKGEVNFLIAYYHYLLMQNYGPVVIVNEEVPMDGDVFYPRNTFDECVAAVSDMFDEAIKTLPDKVQSPDYGRATKVVAQAIKARMYLYAASPLFNGNTDYKDFTNKDGTQLISQSHDNEKWKTAMTEIRKAIDMAHSQGFALYKYREKEISDPFDMAVASARYTMVDPWNVELIWGYSGQKENQDGYNDFQRHAAPRGFRTAGTPYGSLAPTLTAVKIFHSENGLPPEEDPAFDWNNRMVISSGDSTIGLHRNREPRFYAFIGYDRGPYELNGDTATLYLRNLEQNGCPSNRGQDHLYSGYAVKKGIHPDIQITATTLSFKAYPFPIIRLGELYLSYAEACAEYSGQLDADATSYFDAIRTKAGIPTLAGSYGSISGDELVKAVRRERMIEMAFEGHWHYDLRRWLMAFEWFEKDKNGMQGLNEIGKTADEFYKETVLDARNFVFARKNYLFPIKQDYININHNLVQNPGW